jgi:uncharacterized protein involved in exopolysaccharide biosynthesis/Mrp family chromosome partitioning ATPase
MQSSSNSDHRSNPVAPPGLGIKPEDVLFVLFRHKWLIFVFSLLGLAGAIVLYFNMPRTYQSEAKLILRYVEDRKSLGPIGSDSQIHSPDSQGETIINSELEILRSYDIATQVADAIGAEKVLGGAATESNRTAAAIVIRKALTTDVSPKSSVIRLTFQHQNPNLVQPVLEKVIEFYLKKHLEIHRSVGMADEFLSAQMDQLKFRLTNIEDQLWNLKTNSGSVSSEDFKGFGERRARILEELSMAEAQLEEKRTLMQDLQQAPPVKVGDAPKETELPIEKVNDYRSICAQLASLRASLTALLVKFNEEAPNVQRLQAQASDLEKRKLKLEKEEPRLASLGIPSIGGLQATNVANLPSEVRLLEIRIKTFKAQIEQIKTEELAFAKAQNAIAQLQRQKEVDEANYKYYASRREQARIDETLGPDKVSNIKSVEQPTPATRTASKRLKTIGGTFAGGILFGIALAFLIEMFLDKTLKRPGEVKSRLNVPVFSSIPYLNGNPHGRLSQGTTAGRRLLAWGRKSGGATDLELKETTNLEIAPWEESHRLQPFFQDIRERLINYFEAKNVAHKPKLVAVTSCSRGAGVSTLAAGLAASLSETADGNVLLVDMTSSQGGAHPFYKGKPGCALKDVFEVEKREAALVQEKLYVVKASDSGGKMARILPKGLSEIMPKILASDYDYVVFDMPPATPGSITPRLAPHMDMVFMVLEAEKTNWEAARNAASLLAQSNTAVAPVLNKKRNYIPSWLGRTIE